MASSSQRSARDSAGTSDRKQSSSAKGRASTNRRTSGSKPTTRAVANSSGRSRQRSGKASSGSRSSPRGASSRGSAQSRSRSESGGSNSNPESSSGTRTRASSSNGNSRSGSGVKSVVLPVATAMAGAAVGVVGGAVLNRKSRPKHKVLGVTIPSVAIGPGLEKVARQLGEAAGQFGRLAGEVHAAREQAAKIGKALS